MSTGSVTKSNSSPAPKTPGGISKSLLTPCRRVGLSRNWKKSSISPFISPLAGNKDSNENSSKEIKEAGTPEIKPRKRLLENVVNDSPENGMQNCQTTPKAVQQTAKRSKKLITNIQSTIEVVESHDSQPSFVSEDIKPKENDKVENIVIEETNPGIVKLSKNNSKENVSKLSRKKSQKLIKEKSPESLTKECIVVLQRKLLPKENKSNKTEKTISSQNLFDSDTDDTPLNVIKNEKTNKNPIPNTPTAPIIEDDDFASKPVKKLEHRNTSTTDLPQKTKQKKEKPKKQIKIPETQTITSQESVSDEDDFDMSCKRTILIRKTYDKVAKPIRAKTTGSITDKDINEMKKRIEIKKQQLLSKVLTKDTEEVRMLIKKWRKGCQDALIELLDLMKLKCPENNMDYSQILNTLKIPPSLVGYDSDNDCFLTPSDASVVLSKFS